MAPRTVLRLNGLPLATPGADAAAPRAPGRRPRPLSITNVHVSLCRSAPVATYVKRQERTCTYVPPNWDGGFCGEAQCVARPEWPSSRPPGRPGKLWPSGPAVRCPRGCGVSLLSSPRASGLAARQPSGGRGGLSARLALSELDDVGLIKLVLHPHLGRLHDIPDDGVGPARTGIARTQIDQRLHPVSATEQEDDVQSDPTEPGDHARQLDAVRHLQYGVSAADGGHRALVVVGELLSIQAAIEPSDLLRRVLAHLNGGLSELGQRVLHDDARIADGEDPVLPNDARVGIDLDPSRPADRQSPVPDLLVTGNPGRPDHHVDRH